MGQPESKKEVKEASSILLKIKQNVTDTKVLLKKWAESVLMDRKPSKTYSVEEFNQGNDPLVAKRYAEIEADNEKVHNFLSDSHKVLKASKDSKVFKATKAQRVFKATKVQQDSKELKAIRVIKALLDFKVTKVLLDFKVIKAQLVCKVQQDNKELKDQLVFKEIMVLKVLKAIKV